MGPYHDRSSDDASHLGHCVIKKDDASSLIHEGLEPISASEKPVEPHEAVMTDRRSQDDTKMAS